MKFQEILSRFASVSETTDGYLAVCPAHADSRPSLRLWYGEDGKVRIHCRAGCKPGNVTRAAGLMLADLFDAEGPGLTVPKEPPAPAGDGHVAALAFYVDTTSRALFDYDDEWAGEARRYAVRRFGLSEDLMADMELGVSKPGTQFRYASRAFSQYARLTVPLMDFAGRPRGLQGRDLTGSCPGRWVSLSNPEGHRWAAYGVFRGQGGYGVTIVSEGPGDGLTAASVGYDAVSIRGAALAGNPDLLRELAEGLKGSQVIAAGDDDDAGRQFNRRLADGLKPYGITVYALPLSAPDITDWRAQAGPADFPAEFHAAVKAAAPVVGVHEAVAVAATQSLAERTGADFVSRDQGVEAARMLGELTKQYGESHAISAYALVAWTDGRIKHAPELGFMVWNGRVWERSATKVRQEIHRMGAALALAGETVAAKSFLNTTGIDSILTELKSVPSVHVAAHAFDSATHLLTFRNGTVDLRTGQLRPHNPADMMTYSLDIDYRPEATAPRWEKFLAEVFPDNPELPAYMRRMVGYGITGDVSEQAFAVLWGKGANGKSVFTDTLTSVFRNVTRTTGFATFEEKANGGIPNDIAALRGSRLVMASEGEAGKPMSEATLKRATGKEMMQARFLRKEFFEFKPQFLIMLATNHKPRFKGQDEGLWRRVKLIPFTRWFAPHERDYELDRKLLAESEGIAAWAVRGAVEWYARGLGEPSSITEATQEYRATSDALAGFYSADPSVSAVLVKDARSVMNGTDAFSAYLDWCEAENLPMKERWTRRGFYSAMEERGVYKKATNKGVGLVGVRLADAPMAADGPGIFRKDA
ncbi:phage/plasmid primase, P4 family [Streptomyces sp. WI03-4A]|uniref:phage/plasmid primase, P4 family n=1 Tax=Streptomyces sp. WI03-4A TaxID=3028706 RepID=UPI0029A09BAD|nr:phage/plasmid primase, P4 family [Streptomyces sp. WI03-4A]MDX2590967.1 phage/plasmid primase, P4 family [Streptomyces sp. WI03-4A]